ncbi:MAG: hypothetical protein ACKO35_03480, partial [Planctomycetaceae bacterium]
MLLSRSGFLARCRLMAILGAAVVLPLVVGNRAAAQFRGGGGGAGVVVDPQGVLRTVAATDVGLSTERRRAALESLEGDLRKGSP